MGEGGVYVRGELDLVDVVLLESFGGAQREAGPDDVFGIDGRDEEGGFVGGNVVNEVAVLELAAGQVIEEATLAGKFLVNMLVSQGESIKK